ncbi:type II secretion system F family protein [Blastococcus saxobsidens]|uniref:Putative Flp pilus assembly protein TadB n=1 Tax=Blastococcus saxobsidens (strain DD2) TaxID=1146883 RepID=H6RP61_BLASD|nr:pilus assembly protein TadB [Blastococcus saxobsidens]CCG02722.1 putative Flp pilus assembly protein TadB [Blastococcus saxobsidens DD2]
MTAGGLLLTLAGLLLAAGLVGVVGAVRGVSFLPERSPSVRSSSRRGATPLFLGALAAGVLVLLVTGWPAAALGAAGGVVFIPKVLGGGKEAKRLITTSEALADWTRRLADLISSGAAGSTRDALRRSLNSVPEPIAPAVINLVTRMGPQGTETALRQFAREIDDSAAEKIAMVLILRERNGGPGLAEVLTALAADLDDRSRMVREVEAERAKPRSNMRTIVVVTLVLVIGMTLFARTFLSGYSTPFGQIALLAVVAIFATSLRWMRRLSDPVKPPRVLFDPDPAPVHR